MNDRLFKILKKVYFKKKYIKDEKGYLREIDCGDKFDCDTKTIHYATNNLTPAEYAYLIESGYPVNEVVHLTHDQCIEKYKFVLQNENISLRSCLSTFVCGFGSFPRGRQPILSYLFARAVPIHNFVGDVCCPICSIKVNNWLQRGEEIFRLYYGYAWNEGWDAYVIDLEEFSQLPPCEPTENDITVFRTVIDYIRNAPAEETSGKLEQRIRVAKIVPGYEKYRFRGQLMVLAELGIMPNSYIKPLFEGFTPFEERCHVSDKATTNFRSDIILPLSGWRGSNPINEERLNELFGNILNSFKNTHLNIL